MGTSQNRITPEEAREACADAGVANLTGVAVLKAVAAYRSGRRCQTNAVHLMCVRFLNCPASYAWGFVHGLDGLPLVPGVGGAYRIGHGDGKDSRGVLGAGVPS